MNKRIIPLMLMSTAMLLVGCGKKSTSGGQGGSGGSGAEPASGTVVQFSADDFPAATRAAYEATKSGVKVNVSKGTTKNQYYMCSVEKSSTFKISGVSFTKVEMTFSDHVSTDDKHYDGGGFGDLSGWVLASDKLSGVWTGSGSELTFTASNYQVRVMTLSVTLA